MMQRFNWELFKWQIYKHTQDTNNCKKELLASIQIYDKPLEVHVVGTIIVVVTQRPGL